MLSITIGAQQQTSYMNILRKQHNSMCSCQS